MAEDNRVCRGQQVSNVVDRPTCPHIDFSLLYADSYNIPYHGILYHSILYYIFFVILYYVLHYIEFRGTLRRPRPVVA